MEVLNSQRYQICPERKAEWEAWVKKNHHLMEHPADFEARFVMEVLYFVTEITTDNLYPQYEFIDSKGSHRRIDFVILDSSRGFGLAIELDGLSKLSDYGKFEDLLKRQNDLLSKTRDKIFMLFRYANKRWLEHGPNVIEEIRNELQAQQIAYLRLAEHKRTSKELEEKLYLAERERDELEKKLIRLNLQFEAEGHSITDELTQKNAECQELKTIREQSLQKLNSFQNNLINERQLRLKNNVKILQHDKDIIILKQLVMLLIACLIVAIIGITAYLLLNRKAESPVYPTIMATPYSVPNPVEPSFPNPRPYTSIPGERIPQISTFEAVNHVGEDATVCGILTEINTRGSLTYLNLDGHFPNNLFTAAITDAYANQFFGINTSVGSRICVTGRIRKYGRKTGIELTNKSQIRR